MKERKIWVAVRATSEGEILGVFDSYDEIYGLYDYAEQKRISDITYEKLKSGDYYASRYGNTLRAISR